MYPEKQIYDVAGFPTVSGRDLVRGLFAQAAQTAASNLYRESEGRSAALARRIASSPALAGAVADAGARRH